MTRYSQAEKLEIIHLVETSELPVKQTLAELEVPRSTFYDWYRQLQRGRLRGSGGSAAAATAVLEPYPGGRTRAGGGGGAGAN